MEQALANTAGPKRYLWSPVLHRALNESCYFWIMSCSNSRGRQLAAKLDEIHKELGIGGATAYIIQGPYDIILRVWLTPTKRRVYLDVLEEKSEALKLTYLSEFKSSYVDYQWLTDEEVEAQRSLSENEILSAETRELLTASTVEGVMVNDPEIIQKLEKQSLVIPVTDSSHHRIFMFITRDELTEGVPGSRDHDEILTIAGSAGIECVSLYRGSDNAGFCDFLLKGLFARENLIDDIDGIQQKLSQIGYVAWTLPALDLSYVGGCSESVDGLAQQDVKVFLQLLSSANSDTLDKARLEQSLSKPRNIQVANDVLSRVESEIEIIADKDTASRTRRRIQSILAGLLTGSRKRVNRELSFVASIRPDLRDLLDIYKLQEVLDEIDFSTLNIQELAAVLIESMGSSLVDREGIHSTLDPGLFVQLSEFAEDVSQQFYAGTLLPALPEPIVLSDDIDKDLIVIAKAAVFQMEVESLRLFLLDL